MTATTNALELHGLGRRYGGAYVLTDVNLIVSAGKTVVLRGENGAGKTTLLKVLATRLRPSRGQGRVFGFDLIKGAAEVRRRVTFLSVLGGAYGTLTALENLELAATLYQKKLAHAELETALAEVGLLAARHKLVRTFSSGMKKRLGLARLLLSDADLWLLDEPYTALDENGRHHLDTLLSTAKAEGKTVLMASHEASHDPNLVDSVLELKGGRIQALTAPTPFAEVPGV